MSRIIINYPWTFNSLSGQQPSSDLDDNYNAVSSATITIGGRVVTGSTTLINDDNYSFFVCQPVSANMNLTVPSSVNTNYSFFFTNQSTNGKTVSIMTSITVDGVHMLNPSFSTNSGTQRGGYVINDGSTWFMFSKLFLV